MDISIHPDAATMGRAAARDAAAVLSQACDGGRAATLVVATGSSQFEVLASLVTAEGIAWQRVEVFHLDEYVGLPTDHPAGFARYVRERFINRLPAPPAAFHSIGVASDPHEECLRLESLVPTGDFDLALVGIGENAHLAFNDPPADFDAISAYRVVPLDERCRLQQVGEGWFPSLDSVPTRAISMSIRRILASRTIVCSVPDRRKAAAVRYAVEGTVSPSVPASILSTHPDCRLHLDSEAASLLVHPPSTGHGAARALSADVRSGHADARREGGGV